MKCYCVVNFREPLQEMDPPTPTPQGSQVLLKVRAAGVCHSDIHLWEGGYDLGQGRTLSLKDRGVSLPLTIGHETVRAYVARRTQRRLRDRGAESPAHLPEPSTFRAQQPATRPQRRPHPAQTARR